MNLETLLTNAKIDFCLSSSIYFCFCDFCWDPNKDPGVIKKFLFDYTHFSKTESTKVIIWVINFVFTKYSI